MALETFHPLKELKAFIKSKIDKETIENIKIINEIWSLHIFKIMAITATITIIFSIFFIIN